MPSVAWWSWRGCVALCVSAAAVIAVPAALAGGSDPVAVPHARQWLQRAHSAALQRTYQGTLVVSMGGAMSSSRITHYCEGIQAYERVDMLDGRPQRVLRKDDQVLTLWPDTKTARLEQREPIPPFPALIKGRDEQVFDRYDLLIEGPARVAGHDATVLLLRPRDDSRFAQRLWSERSTGLLLRVDVLAPDGRVLETSAFSELAFGVKGKPESVKSALRQLDGWRLHKPLQERVDLEAEGWQLKVPVPGFQQTSCVKRKLGPVGAEAPQEAADVVQVVFTDGLTHVSLFIEPLKADRHRPGSAMVGATHSWTQAVGSHWVTVVGDVPTATLKQFAAALQRAR